jgi:hypothetical protein
MRRSFSFREGRIKTVERKCQAARRVVRIIHHDEGLYHRVRPAPHAAGTDAINRVPTNHPEGERTDLIIARFYIAEEE